MNCPKCGSEMTTLQPYWFYPKNYCCRKCGHEEKVAEVEKPEEFTTKRHPNPETGERD